MTMPSDIGVIDLMIGFPAEDARRHYDYMKANLKDEASAEMEFPAEYMFKDVPEPQGARGRRRRDHPRRDGQVRRGHGDGRSAAPT